MKELKDIVACVVDHGRFVHVARTLGLALGKVYYTSPEQRDCPLIREACIGDGFPELTRVQSLWNVKDKCDLFVFPDIGFSAEQRELRRQGWPVWGAGNADRLEIDKGFFLDQLSRTELPVPRHQVIVGLSNLRAALKMEEEKFIKISRFRGDWETLHWTNYEEMEGTLDAYAVRFGCLKDQVTFYVFDKIDSVVEDGVDAWCVAGQWPQTILHAIECKDKALIGQMMKFADLPEEVRKVSDAFAPVLDLLMGGTGGMKFSTEVRITEAGESFFIDPTCRFGSPPSQGECLLIKNLAEIVARGAHGEMVEPEFEEEFVVQANVTLDGDRNDWNAFKLSPAIEEALKGGFCCQVDGKLCLTPITEYHSQEVGYLCATGKTMKAAIDKLRKLQGELPSGLSCSFASLAEIINQINDAEEQGMEFTDQPVPAPEIVLEESK